jgi:acetolactate synthase I/II/III large subunit
MNNGATALVRTLEALGVTRVFGIPGVQTLELFDALADSSCELVLSTHEGCAAFMADAHARVTGELGVFVVVPGPGATNALTGLAEAWLDGSPVLGIVAAVRSGGEHGFQLHEIPQAELMRPVVKALVPVATAAEIPEACAQAAQQAMAGEPGPVVLEIPFDLMQAPCKAQPTLPAAPTAVPVAQAVVDELAATLLRARAVGIYAGAGCFGAEPALERVAQALQAPVATTISGRGVLPEDHPLCVGYGFGPSGTPIAQERFARLDTLLAVACKYSEPATGSWGVKPPKAHIHVDINPASIGRNLPVTQRVVADARDLLPRLAQALEAQPRPSDPGLLQAIAAGKARELQRVLDAARSSEHVTPARLLRALRARLDRGAIITTDSGNHQFATLGDLPVLEPRSYITPADFQAMGFGIPAAVAAKLAHPERQVVAVVGDGGLLMTGLELLTAQRAGARPTVLLFRDGRLGSIHQAQGMAFRRTHGTELALPDLELLSGALGMAYHRIDHDGRIDAVLDGALAAGGGVLIDARVAYIEPSRYLQGAAKASFQQAPVGLKLRMATRLIQRSVLQAFYGGDES